MRLKPEKKLKCRPVVNPKDYTSLKLFLTRADFVFFPRKHFLRKISILVLIFVWIFSGIAPGFEIQEARVT